MTSRYDSYQGLKIAHPAPRILEVIFDRPGKLNAIDSTMHRELVHVWRDIEEDREVSCVLLRGADGAFSAGGDLDWVESITEDFDARMEAWKEARDLVYNVINCSKPIVSAIQGPAVGAGLACAILSDVSVAGRTARIIDGHTRLGVAAGDHAVIVWPLLCGMAKAKYHLLLCKPLDGEEAERIGLVSLCVDDDKVIETAMEVCHQFVAAAPAAVRWTKYALNNWLRMAGPAFDASLAFEFLGMNGPEVREGVRALKEKRRPKFDPDTPV